MRPSTAFHQRWETAAQAGETLDTNPQSLPVCDRVGEQRGKPVEVAALQELPCLLGCVDPGEEGRSGRAPLLPALREARGRASGPGSTPPGQFGLRTDCPHLPEQGRIPEALDPDRLLGPAVQPEDELDEEDGISDCAMSCVAHDLPGLPA